MSRPYLNYAKFN